MSDLSYVRNNDGTYSKLVQLSGSNVPDAQRLPMKITNGSVESAITLSADGQGSAYGLITTNRSQLHNGTTWDMQRNNTEGTLLASVARTATTTSPKTVNYNARGILVFLNVTASSGTGGLRLRIRGYDPVSNNVFYLNNDPSAIIATGKSSYLLYPGVNDAASNGNVTQVVNSVLPRNFDIYVVHADGSSYTYSVGYSLIL